MSLMIPISRGELFDRLTILQIKVERIGNKDKLKNITKELAELSKIADFRPGNNPNLDLLVKELHEVNIMLWDIEDDIRGCERAGDFGSAFVELARSVYKTNDLRAELKYRINTLLGSELVEEKSYESY